VKGDKFMAIHPTPRPTDLAVDPAPAPRACARACAAPAEAANPPALPRPHRLDRAASYSARRRSHVRISYAATARTKASVSASAASSSQGSEFIGIGHKGLGFGVQG